MLSEFVLMVVAGAYSDSSATVLPVRGGSTLQTHQDGTWQGQCRQYFVELQIQSLV